MTNFLEKKQWFLIFADKAKVTIIVFPSTPYSSLSFSLLSLVQTRQLCKMRTALVLPIRTVPSQHHCLLKPSGFNDNNDWGLSNWCWVPSSHWNCTGTPAAGSRHLHQTSLLIFPTSIANISKWKMSWVTFAPIYSVTRASGMSVH